MSRISPVLRFSLASFALSGGGGAGGDLLLRLRHPGFHPLRPQLLSAEQHSCRCALSSQAKRVSKKFKSPSSSSSSSPSSSSGNRQTPYTPPPSRGGGGRSTQSAGGGRHFVRSAAPTPSDNQARYATPVSVILNQRIPGSRILIVGDGESVEMKREDAFAKAKAKGLDLMQVATRPGLSFLVLLLCLFFF